LYERRSPLAAPGSPVAAGGAGAPVRPNEPTATRLLRPARQAPTSPHPRRRAGHAGKGRLKAGPHRFALPPGTRIDLPIRPTIRLTAEARFEKVAAASRGRRVAEWRSDKKPSRVRRAAEGMEWTGSFRLSCR